LGQKTTIEKRKYCSKHNLAFSAMLMTYPTNGNGFRSQLEDFANYRKKGIKKTQAKNIY
jgi:hypothetical protein